MLTWLAAFWRLVKETESHVLDRLFFASPLAGAAVATAGAAAANADGSAKEA